jgi:hypothetical protein
MKKILGIIGDIIFGLGVRGLYQGRIILGKVLPNISFTYGNIGLIILGFILVAVGFNNKNKKTEK